MQNTKSIRHVTANSNGPMVITQNGKTAAALMDIHGYKYIQKILGMITKCERFKRCCISNCCG